MLRTMIISLVSTAIILIDGKLVGLRDSDTKIQLDGTNPLQSEHFNRLPKPSHVRERDGEQTVPNPALVNDKIRLLQWIKSNGGALGEGVLVHGNGAAGVLLQAEAPLPDGSLVASVPAHLHIRVESAWNITALRPAIELVMPGYPQRLTTKEASTDLASRLARLGPGLEPLAAPGENEEANIVMHLMLYHVAFVQGRDSFFAPLIASLTKQLSLVQDFDEPARALLGVVPLYGQLYDVHTQQVDAFARLIRHMAAVAPDGFPPVQDAAELRKRASWVTGTVKSRSHSGRFRRGTFVTVRGEKGQADRQTEITWEDPPAIVPFSLLNHGVAGAVPQGHLPVVEPGVGTTYIWRVARGGLATGQEILQSYHGHTDMLQACRWAALYGFVPAPLERSPADWPPSALHGDRQTGQTAGLAGTSLERAPDDPVAVRSHPALPGASGYGEADAIVISFSVSVHAGRAASVNHGIDVIDALLQQSWLGQGTRRHLQESKAAIEASQPGQQHAFTLGGSPVFVLSNQSWARGLIDFARAATATAEEAASGQLAAALSAARPVSACSELKATRYIANTARSRRRLQQQRVAEALKGHPQLGLDPAGWSPTVHVAYDLHLSDLRAALYVERLGMELWQQLVQPGAAGSVDDGPDSVGLAARRAAAERARGRGVGDDVLEAVPEGELGGSSPLEELCS